MDENINFAPRPGARSGVTGFFLAFLLVGICALFAGALLTGCKDTDRTQAIRAASVVPAPSSAMATTIRTRVAAVVKREVAAHPQVAPWGNELAKGCFRFSTVHLPSPSTLNAAWTVAKLFVPSAAANWLAALADTLLKLYSADYPAALAVQASGTPYLTLFGQGIQDGIAAAGVGEAP